MRNNTLQRFIREISALVQHYCGENLIRRFNTFQDERERILNDVWTADLLPEDIPLYQKDCIARDIDFDTIVHYAEKQLDMSTYLQFLYDAAEISIRFGELSRSERVLKYLQKSYRRKPIKPLRARVEQSLGKITFYRNDFKAAQGYYQKSLRIYTELNDQKGIISIKNAMGAMMVEMGDIIQGERFLREALKAARAVPLPEYVAKTSMNLGNIYQIMGDYDQAIESYHGALEALDDDDKTGSLAPLYNNIGQTHTKKGEYQKALQYLVKSQTVAKDTEDLYSKAFSFLFQSELYCHRGEYSKSIALVTSAFSIFSEMGDRLSIAEAYKVLGIIHRESQRFYIAQSYFTNSIRINEQYRNATNVAEVQVEMALLLQAQGEIAAARKTVQAALRYFEKVGARTRIEQVRRTADDLLQ